MKYKLYECINALFDIANIERVEPIERIAHKLILRLEEMRFINVCTENGRMKFVYNPEKVTEASFEHSLEVELSSAYHKYRKLRGLYQIGELLSICYV